MFEGPSVDACPVLWCKAQGNEDEGIVRFSATRAELLEPQSLQDVEGFQTTSYWLREAMWSLRLTGCARKSVPCARISV